MATSLVGMLAAAFGYLPPVHGAVLQEVIDILAVMNALRTIWKPSNSSLLSSSFNSNNWFGRRSADFKLKQTGVVKHL